MKDYSAIIAVSDIEKPMIDPDLMEVVGIYREHIILKEELDPEDIIKTVYISTGDLHYFDAGLEDLESGIYRLTFQVSDIQKCAVSLEGGQEFEAQEPEIENIKVVPVNWPVEDSPEKKTSSILF